MQAHEIFAYNVFIVKGSLVLVSWGYIGQVHC